MKKLILSIAIGIVSMFNATAQIHQSKQIVKNGLGKETSISMTVLSEPSEGSFMNGFSSEYTELVCCGESLSEMDVNVLINRIASSASISSKYACSVKSSWEPTKLVLMWSESYEEYFGTFYGYASNAYGVKDEVKITLFMDKNGNIHR